MDIQAYQESVIIFMANLSSTSVVTEQTGEGFYIAQFKTTHLAIYSYYLESQKECLIIDPIFDIEKYENLIKTRNSVLKYVLLTHYHADFLAGHTEFKAPIVMGPTAARKINTFKVKECTDGEVLSLGSVKLKVWHTPGHTLESSCYHLIDSANKDAALFTGDTVFLGQVGRPDLACSSNITSADLAGMLYDSIQKIRKLQGTMRLYPGHGAGSNCGKSISAGHFCTVGNQNTNNYGFKFTNREEFIKQVAGNLPKPPKYFFYDAMLNQTGPPSTYEQVFKKAHVLLTHDQFMKLKDKFILIDARMNIEGGIVKGAYWLPYSMAVCNYISHFVAPEDEMLIIADPGHEIEVFNRLFRIGFFNIKGYANFDVSQEKTIEKAKFETVNAQTLQDLKERTHLDVRHAHEQQSMGIIEGAITIPLPQLEGRVNELKGKKNIVVNCMTGVRASVAFSVLAKHDIQSRVLKQDFKQLKNKGIKVVDFKG